VNFLSALFSTSFIGPLLTALIMLVSGFYINRSAKNEAEKAAKDAYTGAIVAMKEHINALQERIKDTETENRHLRETTDTILELLKARDIYITVQGHSVTVREGKETIVTHIRKEEET
jgi:phage host-nuclease inhibitor protein Gam